MPQIELLNAISILEQSNSDIEIIDLETGRVGFCCSIRATFDEVYELNAFPFDSQVLDIRVCYADSFRYSWKLVPHGIEKNVSVVVSALLFVSSFSSNTNKNKGWDGA